ncbi:hypothetical protein QTP88_011534 [Uroleucon formosanum]
MFNIKRSNLVEIIDNGLETNFRSNDIGLFANCILTDADKKIVLKNLWVPNVNYEFPLLGKYKAREFENQGNFRAILKYRSHGDTFLNNILEEGNGYKYISPKIQNEIVCICDQLILKEIVEKVNAAEGFAVLADETTDITTKNS